MRARKRASVLSRSGRISPGAPWQRVDPHRMANMRTITVIPTLADNYTYLLECDGEAVAIDPGEASPVLRRLRETGSALLVVLLTH